MRARHAEKLRQKRLLRALLPSARVARLAMDVGDEAVVFLPDGQMAHLLREDEVRFRVRELSDIDAAATVAMRWNAEKRAAETVS